MPSPNFRRKCQLAGLPTRTLSEAEQHLERYGVGIARFRTNAAKLEASAVLEWASHYLKRGARGALNYSAWTKLKPVEFQSIRELYDIPNATGRPLTKAAIARHFWDHRPNDASPASPTSPPESEQSDAVEEARPASSARRPFPASGLSRTSQDQRQRRSGSSSRDPPREQSREPSRDSSPDLLDDRQPQRLEPHDRSNPDRPRPALTIRSASDLLWQYDAIVDKLSADQRALFDLTLPWTPEKKRQCIRALSSAPAGFSNFLGGNDLALFTFQINLMAPAPPVGRAATDGPLIALAARFPDMDPYGLPGSMPGLLSYYYHHGQDVWNQALAQLLDPAVEITATSLGRVKSFVVEKFKDRARWAEAEMVRIGLPQAADAAKSQHRQVRKLFILHDEAISHIYHRGSSWSANKTWFHLFMPFFHEHLGAPLVVWKDSLPPPPQPSQWPLYALPSSALAAGGSVFLPISADIVGSALALRQSPPLGMTCRSCSSALHSSWECPRRYAQVLSQPCPGFDALGHRVLTAWNNSNLTDATKQAWIAYISAHGLRRSRHATTDVRFQ